MSIRPQKPAPATPAPGKLPITELAEMKARRQPIVMVTAYDAPGGRLADEAGADLVLVGDSAAMTVLGHDSTVPATMEEMLMLTRAVTRGASRPLVIADMPFGSFQVSDEDAVAQRDPLREGGGRRCGQARGCRRRCSRASGRSSAPESRCMGHIGLTPQSATMLGGYKAQGRSAEKALALLADARALEAAGCFSLVLEAVPAPVAARITRELSIPTIGIGAGADCDGQVLVWHDLLGLYDGPHCALREALRRDRRHDPRRARRRTPPTYASAASRRSSTRTRCRHDELALFEARCAQIIANTPTIAASSATAATSEASVRSQLQPCTTRTPITSSASDHATNAELQREQHASRRRPRRRHRRETCLRRRARAAPAAVTSSESCERHEREADRSAARGGSPEAPEQPRAEEQREAEQEVPDDAVDPAGDERPDRERGPRRTRACRGCRRRSASPARPPCRPAR